MTIRTLLKEYLFKTLIQSPQKNFFKTGFLQCSSYLYGCGSYVDRNYRLNWKDQYRFEVPTISVGNITWGGTGKTPMVEYLAKTYLQHGIRPLILMRGYGDDEEHMLKSKIPDAIIGIGKNRIESYNKAKRDSPKFGVVILDDGLQSYHIARDVNIIMINALDPFGPNEKLIPWGTLREKPGSALLRADLIVLHNANHVDRETIDKIKKKISSIIECPIIETAIIAEDLFSIADPTKRHMLETLKGKDLLAFSGIGCPQSFEQSLRTLEPKSLVHLSFLDHHTFSNPELSNLKQLSIDQTRTMVTTEKDYYRIRSRGQMTLLPETAIIMSTCLKCLNGEMKVLPLINEQK